MHSIQQENIDRLNMIYNLSYIEHLDWNRSLVDTPTLLMILRHYKSILQGILYIDLLLCLNISRLDTEHIVRYYMFVRKDTANRMYTEYNYFHPILVCLNNLEQKTYQILGFQLHMSRNNDLLNIVHMNKIHYYTVYLQDNCN